MSERSVVGTRHTTLTGSPAAHRTRLRSTVTLAARALPVHYPLETFIAVNPLGGFEHLSFEAALRTAAKLYGAQGTLPEPEFRRAHAAGRITDADLDSVLRRRYPDAVAAPEALLAARGVSPLAVLRADLQHGAPVAPASQRDGLRSAGVALAVAEAVDAQMSQWCGAYLAAPDTPWAMPGWQDGFFPAWRRLAPRDRTLPRVVRHELARIPHRSDDALLAALDALAVPPAEHRTYLTAHLTRMPGFAAHVRWRAEHGESGIDLVDYLAVQLSYEVVLISSSPANRNAADQHTGTDLGPPAANPPQRAAALRNALGLDTDDELGAGARVLAAMPPGERTAVWLDAYEDHYRRALLTDLDTVGPTTAPAGGRAAAQVVCCIDVRSEGLRRHLEQRGPYETLGFAGFFAVAISFTDLARGAATALCPVLIDPSHAVTERPEPGTAELAARRVTGLATAAGADEAFHTAKDGLLTPFALAETAGWAAGPVAAARTLLPRWAGAVRARWRARLSPGAPTELEIGLTEDEQALFAEVALTTMGLTGGFARLVVLCAHGATSENNPYQAALDCGACGGQPGGPNARTAAAILNNPVVRRHLRCRGVEIPEDTYIVAAEHDTTTDLVTILDPHLVPTTHEPDVADLRHDLHHAGRSLAAERGRTLPGAPRARSDHASSTQVATRSTDWAQVYPEWGLAGNAAFVVGPRTMTAGLDLGRRVFLHSYDAGVDPDGAALETILTAPMVVAQWISCQYYFSAVAPDVFGAGTKTIHNVLGGVGVLAGHAGDLQLGLPWQSLAYGDQLVHEPMRLFTVVQAPRSLVQSVIDRNPVLGRLFGNGWVALAVREHPGAPWQRWTLDGWRPWAGPPGGTPPDAPEETP